MEELWILTGIMEIFFLISMYSNFMTDYLPEGSSEPVRDLQKIAIRYLKGDFFMQFLALIPFTFFIEIDRVFVHLYLLKVSRAFNAIKFFDVQKIFNNIKMIVRNQTIAMITKDPLVGEDTSSDHNQVEFLLLVKYMIRTVKLVVIILNFSYFGGLSWLIMCEINSNFTHFLYNQLAETEVIHKFMFFN